MPDMSILLQMCTERVYDDNIFHVIGLQTTATTREVRRRKEDLESAHDMGEESWKSEFRHLLGNRPVPTFEEVQIAFEHLADPEYRIVSEFFWLWPQDDSDAALKALAEGKRSVAFKIWEQAALGFGKKRSIAQHNLAIAYQFYAIDAELQAIESEEVPEDFHLQMCDYWEKSFSYWEDLADSDDFWHIFETRMREFDDPRLNGDLVRSFRIQFPVAFDNINARLAAEYAKHDKFSEAKRHVDYMLKTMSGLDNVDETLRILFEPMERKVAALIRRRDEVIAQDPVAGFESAKALLDESDEILRIVRGVLNKNQRIRTVILTDVFHACNRYIVAYGNKTEKWDVCLEVLKLLSPMACTPETAKLLAKNVDVVTKNAEALALKKEEEELQKVCCVCGKREGQKTFWGGLVSISRQAVSLYGNVQRDYSSFGAVRYSTMKIEVPHCQKCGHLQESQMRLYKPIARAFKDGYKIGDKPSRASMREAWGLPPTQMTLPRRSLFNI